jgi:hypothetical protein
MGQRYAGVQAGTGVSLNAGSLAIGQRARRAGQSVFVAQLQLFTSSKFAVDRAAAGYNM